MKLQFLSDCIQIASRIYYSNSWIMTKVLVSFQVSLITSNALGLSKAGPTVSKGWSAESPPTIAPYRLRATRVDASMAELLWEWPTFAASAINGFFIGIRIEWCLAERNQMCDRYKVTQVRLPDKTRKTSNLLWKFISHYTILLQEMPIPLIFNLK